MVLGWNEEAPTLRPSLHAVGIWHGWVTAGQLKGRRHDTFRLLT